MKKLLLILLSLTLCACQAQIKPTSSTSKKACDATSTEEKCDSTEDTKTKFNEISFDEAIQYFTEKNLAYYILAFPAVLGAKRLNLS